MGTISLLAQWTILIAIVLSSIIVTIFALQELPEEVEEHLETGAEVSSDKK